MTISEPNPARDEAVALLPCPFCGGPAKTFQLNGTLQASCAGDFTDCAGFDVTAPVAMWNRRVAAKPPASGVDAVALEREACAAVCEARADYFDRAKGYREWTDAARSYRATAKEIRARASLSPAATSGSEAGGEAWRYPKRWGEGLSFEHPGKCFDDDGNEVEPTPLYLAKPASSPAGGDAVEREVAAQATLARIKKLRDQYADQAKFADVDEARLFRQFVERLDRAALSPSTSAAEPVAKRWLVEEHLPSGLIQWSCYKHERMARDEAASFENPTTVTPLYATPPAPAAVDGQRVKVRDWLAVARAAGQHGIRYRTNRALEAFLSEIRACLATDKEGA